MEKRKITARDIAKDIKLGVDDQELMRRYNLSAQGLQRVFEKLIKAEVVTKEELDERVPVFEKTVDLGLFFCPACGNTQGREFKICPRCAFELPQKDPINKNSDETSKTTATDNPTPIVDNEVLAKESDVTTPSETQETEPRIGELSKVASWCKRLAVIAFLSYLAVFGGFIFMLNEAGTQLLNPNHFLIYAALLGIPAIVVAFLLLVVLRAVAESLNLIVHIASGLKRKKR